MDNELLNKQDKMAKQPEIELINWQDSKFIIKEKVSIIAKLNNLCYLMVKELKKIESIERWLENTENIWYDDFRESHKHDLEISKMAHKRLFECFNKYKKCL